MSPSPGCGPRGQWPRRYCSSSAPRRWSGWGWLRFWHWARPVACCVGRFWPSPPACRCSCWSSCCMPARWRRSAWRAWLICRAPCRRATPPPARRSVPRSTAPSAWASSCWRQARFMAPSAAWPISPWPACPPWARFWRCSSAACWPPPVLRICWSRSGGLTPRIKGSSYRPRLLIAGRLAGTAHIFLLMLDRTRLDQMAQADAVEILRVGEITRLAAAESIGRLAVYQQRHLVGEEGEIVVDRDLGAADAGAAIALDHLMLVSGDRRLVMHKESREGVAVAAGVAVDHQLGLVFQSPLGGDVAGGVAGRSGERQDRRGRESRRCRHRAYDQH